MRADLLDQRRGSAETGTRVYIVCLLVCLKLINFVLIDFMLYFIDITAKHINSFTAGPLSDHEFLM